MRIFLDTEFTALHQKASLISIGLAAENGDVFYAQLTDYDKLNTSDWVLQNVIPLLSSNLHNAQFIHTDSITLCEGNILHVSEALRSWFLRFGGKNSVEIWADVLAWDWVIFCEIFGGTIFLPEQLLYIPLDLSTALKLAGIDPDTDRQTLGSVQWSHPLLNLQRHHALYDALLEKSVFEHTTGHFCKWGDFWMNKS
jgi:hypothetical protein